MCLAISKRVAVFMLIAEEGGAGILVVVAPVRCAAPLESALMLSCGTSGRVRPASESSSLLYFLKRAEASL